MVWLCTIKALPGCSEFSENAVIVLVEVFLKMLRASLEIFQHPF